jgi:hypothetical protein
VPSAKTSSEIVAPSSVAEVRQVECGVAASARSRALTPSSTEAWGCAPSPAEARFNRTFGALGTSTAPMGQFIWLWLVSDASVIAGIMLKRMLIIPRV